MSFLVKLKKKNLSINNSNDPQEQILLLSDEAPRDSARPSRTLQTVGSLADKRAFTHSLSFLAEIKRKTQHLIQGQKNLEP